MKDTGNARAVQRTLPASFSPAGNNNGKSHDRAPRNIADVVGALAPRYGIKKISLRDSLDQPFLKLPLAAVRDVGPAAQTLAGVMTITRRETYCGLPAIAAAALLPIPTVRKHFKKLEARGWIDHRGRHFVSAGRLCKTPTRRITQQANDTMRPTDEEPHPWIPLPAWAAQSRRLNWGSKVVLAVVMEELMSLKSAIENNPTLSSNHEESFWEAIDFLGGDKRFRFSLAALERRTGLNHKTLCAAKAELARRRIIYWDGDGCTADLLSPRHDFRVAVEVTENGDLIHF